MRVVVAALSLLLFAAPAFGAPSADYCAGQESVGVHNVQCYGADPAAGNNDTNAIYRAWCHAIRQDQGQKRAKTIYFPAGEYRVNFSIGFDLNWPYLDSLTLQGDGMDQSVLIKDTSVAAPDETWSVVNSNWTNALDPAYCTGDWVYFWNHSGAGNDHQAHHAVWVSTSTSATTPVNLTVAGLTLDRASRVYPAVFADDVAVYFVSPGTATFDGSRVKDFFFAFRNDWAPATNGTNYRPQKFVSKNAVWEDLANGPNGDGAVEVTGSTFRRCGWATAPYGHAIYWKRTPSVLVSNSRIEAPIGHGLMFLNDHDGGGDGDWSYPGETITITGNYLEGHIYTFYTDLNNPHVRLMIENNTFAVGGTVRPGGAFESVDIRNNTFHGVQLCLQTCDPNEATRLRAKPSIVNNTFVGGSIGAAVQDAQFSGNGLFGTPTWPVNLTALVRSSVKQNFISATATEPVPGTVKILTFDGSNWRE